MRPAQHDGVMCQTTDSWTLNTTTHKHQCTHYMKWILIIYELNIINNKIYRLQSNNNFCWLLLIFNQPSIQFLWNSSMLRRIPQIEHLIMTDRYWQTLTGTIRYSQVGQSLHSAISHYNLGKTRSFLFLHHRRYSLLSSQCTCILLSIIAFYNRPNQSQTLPCDNNTGISIVILCNTINTNDRHTYTLSFCSSIGPFLHN